MDNDHQHKITGDLWILKNIKSRNSLIEALNIKKVTAIHGNRLNKLILRVSLIVTTHNATNTTSLNLYSQHGSAVLLVRFMNN